MTMNTESNFQTPTHSTKGGLRLVWKIFFRTLAVLLSMAVLAVVVGYNYVMRPEFLEPIIIEQFAEQTNGKLEIKLAQTSLFRGFAIRNLKITGPKEYGNEPIVQADEINFLYNVYGFYSGKFGVHEIALKNPRIRLIERNNKSNLEALLKPTEKKAPKPKEKEEKEIDDKSPKQYSWFFDIRFFARFVIDNLHFVLDADHASNKTRSFAEIKNFTFHFSLLTHDFNQINTSPADVIALLRLLSIELNPQKTVALEYRDQKFRFKNDLNLFWLLFYNGYEKIPEFVSAMDIGRDRLGLSVSGRAIQNLALAINHLIDYDPKADTLEIKNFKVSLLGDTWLSLTGKGTQVIQPTRNISIRTEASAIHLGKIYNLMTLFTGKADPYLAGVFSIKPTSVDIVGNRIIEKGGLKLAQVYVKTGGLLLSIPTFEFDDEVVYNPALGIVPVENGKARMRGIFNGGSLSMDTELAKDKKFFLDFALRSLEVGSLAMGNASGSVNVVTALKGDTLHDLNLDFRFFSPAFHYYVDRGKSGVNRLDMRVKGNIKSSANFQELIAKLPMIEFFDKEKEYGTAVALKSNAIINIKKDIDIKYNLESFDIYFKELIPTLTPALQETLGGVFQMVSLGKLLHAQGHTEVLIAGNEKCIQHLTQLALPDKKINDIVINARLRLLPDVMHLEQFTVNGLKEALQISATGSNRNTTEMKADEKNPRIKRRVAKSVPDFRYKILLGKSDETEIFPNNFLVGLFSVIGNIKGDIAAGEIKIDQLSYKMQTAKINKVNLLFPYRHDLELKKTLNLRGGNKEHIIKNYNFNKATNFSIESVEIPHPQIPREWWKLLYSRGGYPALGATMEYKDNVFLMPVMQVFTLNGLVTISDTLFNLGRLKLSEMEYTSTIQIKDIDLKQTMSKEKADTITDGILRIDMMITGNRLDKPVENMTGYLSVYRIGPEFAKMVVKAAKPDDSNLISMLANNSISVDKIDLDIKEGLIYADIPTSRRLLGIFAAPENIRQERIKIPEFLQRISTEASVYSSSPADAN